MTYISGVPFLHGHMSNRLQEWSGEEEQLKALGIRARGYPVSSKVDGKWSIYRSLWIQSYLLRKWDWGIIYYTLEGYISTFSDSGHGSIYR